LKAKKVSKALVKKVRKAIKHNKIRKHHKISITKGIPKKKYVKKLLSSCKKNVAGVLKKGKKASKKAKRAAKQNIKKCLNSKVKIHKLKKVMQKIKAIKAKKVITKAEKKLVKKAKIIKKKILVAKQKAIKSTAEIKLIAKVTQKAKKVSKKVICADFVAAKKKYKKALAPNKHLMILQTKLNKLTKSKIKTSADKKKISELKFTLAKHKPTLELLKAMKQKIFPPPFKKS